MQFEGPRPSRSGKFGHAVFKIKGITLYSDEVPYTPDLSTKSEDDTR